MRETRNAQYSIFDNYSAHPIGQRLSRLSDLLDGYPGLLEILVRDFRTTDTTVSLHSNQASRLRVNQAS